MKRSMIMVSIAMGLLMSAASADGSKPNRAAARKCAPDAVQAGSVCLDTYEASVWRVPDPTTTNALLVKRILSGIATRADLTAGGATQLGTADDDFAPCLDNGQNCTNDIYAVSLPGVLPSANITWFQALEACANAGKRLPTNAEWQVAANGSPDPGPDNGTTDCNSGNTGSASLTGSRSSCVSARGAFDMVGNLAEWVAEWVPASANCPNWGSFSDDAMCLSGASTTLNFPAALVRGGGFDLVSRSTAGPLSVVEAPPSESGLIGFRCTR